ncbi:MAG: hypothetical protein EXR78_02640 [Deltaproteobacteria bacterium]|nr:hypothetical protein [Deltaproteobacteria bacterium]
MGSTRFGIAVLLGLVFNGPGYTDGSERGYTLTPYDVPQSAGNNTSLFDLTKEGRVILAPILAIGKMPLAPSRKKEQR